ncbi:DUF2088 domain-containing protein [Candidatus Micrarchaeota archaeon]|nr:DUF2088 domain-containing protein [Candidatus Micrarchaeota archaeon]
MGTEEMKTVEVCCGDEKIALEIPEKNFAGTLKPKSVELRSDFENVFNEAMEKPFGRKLSELVAGKRVCLITEDDTRNVSETPEMVKSICRELQKGGAAFVHCVIATGTHSSTTKTNLEIAAMLEKTLAEFGLQGDAEVHDDESEKKEEEYTRNVFVGKTKAGTELWVNKKVVASDVMVYAGNMKPHYFAGYSNFLKGISIPGPCAYKTILQNHYHVLNEKATVCSHPFDSEKTDNPVANDMLDSFRIVTKGKEAFILMDVSEKKDGKLGIFWAGAGEPEAVTRAGIKVIRENFVFKLELADVLICGNGPYPGDKHLYYVQNGMDMTKGGVKQGGKILVVAECRDGFGPEGGATEAFISALSKPKNEILEYIKKNFRVGMQKAYKMGELVNSVDVCFFVSEKGKLTEEKLKQIHMTPVRDCQAWLDEQLKQNPEARVLVIEKSANKMAVVS